MRRSVKLCSLPGVKALIHSQQLSESSPGKILKRSIIEAEVLAEPETLDLLGLVVESYSQLRRYTPTLVETFDFRAASAVAPVMAAIEAVRAMNRSGSRDLP